MWSFFGKMQHDVQHAKSSPSIKRDIYNCENRFSETENLLLNNNVNKRLEITEKAYSGNYDFNSIEDQGVYTIGNFLQAVNAPDTTSSSGILIVYKTAAYYISQHLITNAGYWFRLKVNENYRDWIKL